MKKDFFRKIAFGLSPSEKINEDLKETLSYRTFYEEKWLKDGIKIKYLSFSINS